MSKILIVDDDHDISELISVVLTKEGYETCVRYDGRSALLEIQNNEYDLILLDIMMPELSGTELCNKIRERVSCPIVFVTAKNSLVDKMLGFEIGADDYITKPFEIEELVSRVKAHLRREKRHNTNSGNIIKIGEIEINTDSFEVKKNGELIPLSTREFELLSYMMKNAGIVLSKEQIFNSVWGIDYGEIGTVAVHIKNLRTKLDKEEKYIITIWGYGYKFVKAVN